MKQDAARLLDSAAISGVYLFPQPRTVADPCIVGIGEIELACYRRIVQTDWLTLVHFHGNGEAIADYVPEMADAFARLNLNSLFVEYRGYGGSTGKAQLVSMLGDGQTVLESLGIVAEKAIVFGRSIGSLYAIELVQRQPNVAGLILESGIADPAERFLAYADVNTLGCTPDEVRTAANCFFDHQKKLSNYRGPTLIMHTEGDQMVDVSHAERNYQWVGASCKRLLRFVQGDHNSIMAWNQQEYFEAIERLVVAIHEWREGRVV